MPDELTKALLLEEAASERAVAEALFASVTGEVPLVQALVEARAVTPEVLARYLARTEAPYVRQVVPLFELVDRLPPGICARLLAIPVRRDAITGTVDVVVADANDPHPAKEIAFHLGVPVRVLRGTTMAIEEALRRLRSRSLPPSARADAREMREVLDDDRMFDSRPRAAAPLSSFKRSTPPPPSPPPTHGPSARAVLDAMTSAALRPSRIPASDRQAHVVPAAPNARGHSYAPRRPSSVTPPWGTPVHNNSVATPPSEHPTSGLGSEIPIPLTRRTFTAVSGGTQRPPPLVNPAESALGEGYAVDAGHFRQIVEVNERMRSAEPDGAVPAAQAGRQMPDAAVAAAQARQIPDGAFIPGPPALPAGGSFGAFAPQVPAAEIGGILAALRAAGARDEVLELVLTGARIVALKVGLFVVKRGGYLGWACTPEFADRAALQSILVPVESASVFEEAVRDGLYLGPIRHDETHASLLHVMRGASRDVAVVPIRVSGKTAVVLMADELGDTMLATRRLEELSRAAGEALARIVRMRR